MIRGIRILTNFRKRHDLCLSVFHQPKGRSCDIGNYSTTVGIPCSSVIEKKLGSLFKDLIGTNEDSEAEGAALSKNLTKRVDLEEAMADLEETEELGVTPKVKTCTTLVEGLCLHGRTVSGYEMLQACRAIGVPIEASGYNVVIRGYCNEKKVQEAETVMQDMKKHGVTPNAQSYTVLIHGYCRSGNMLKALSVHDEMLSAGFKTNCTILNSLLQCKCGMDMSREAAEEFQRFKNSGRAKWGLSLMLSLAVHDFKEMDLHVRQLSYSGMTDPYNEARDRVR